MPSEQIVQQQIGVPEPMTTGNAIVDNQPVSTIGMRPSLNLNLNSSSSRCTTDNGLAESCSSDEHRVRRGQHAWWGVRFVQLLWLWVLWRLLLDPHLDTIWEYDRWAGRFMMALQGYWVEVHAGHWYEKTINDCLPSCISSRIWEYAASCCFKLALNFEISWSISLDGSFNTNSIEG